MPFDDQPTLRSNLVVLKPLQPEDYEALFTVAADPLIWEQHPAKNRYQKAEFQAFFQESLASGGALLVTDLATDRVIGSYRYYGYSQENSEIEIGWIFLARSHWGGKYNGEIIKLMLNHALKYADRVVYLVAPDNIRSQRAVEKIGGVRIASRPDASGHESYVYQLDRTSKLAPG